MNRSGGETLQRLNGDSSKQWHTKHTQSFTRTLTDADTHVAISGGLTRKSGLLPAYQLRNTNWWVLLSAWVTMHVCVSVRLRVSASYLDVPVTNVRWDRSWDLTGDGGGYQLLTPLYMWTCWTAQKETVKTLICINNSKTSYFLQIPLLCLFFLQFLYWCFTLKAISLPFSYALKKQHFFITFIMEYQFNYCFWGIATYLKVPILSPMACTMSHPVHTPISGPIVAKKPFCKFFGGYFRV